MKKTVPVMAFAGLILSALATHSAWAATSSYGTVYATVSAPWSDTLHLNKFDASLGTLTGVQFNYSGVATYEMSIDHAVTGTATISSLGGYFQYSLPGLIILQTIQTNAAFAYSGSGFTTYPVGTLTDNVLSQISNSQWAAWTGTGQIDIPVVATKTGVLTGFDGLSAPTFDSHVKMGVNMSVIYSYTPAVPEPETYAMMLMGLAGLGLLARRKA